MFIECHNIYFLLEKSSKFGIHGRVLQWFTSYLHVIDRIQHEWASVKSGVPQGSGGPTFIVSIH